MYNNNSAVRHYYSFSKKLFMFSRCAKLLFAIAILPFVKS